MLALKNNYLAQSRLVNIAGGVKIDETFAGLDPSAVSYVFHETGDGHIAALLLNASLDPAETLSVMIRTKSRAGEWVGMDCATSKIRAAGGDGAYAQFEIPRLAPWDAALLIV